MTETRTRRPFMSPARLSIALGSWLLVSCFSPSVHAQEPSKGDDALEKLLEEIDASNSDSGKKPEANVDPKQDVEPADRPEQQARPSMKPKGDPEKAKVAPKDEALDSLLEKLGEGEDAPETKDKPEPPNPDQPKPDQDPSKSDEEPMPGMGKKSGEPKPPGLGDDAKQLDEHLEEITGRRKNNRKKQGDGQGGQGQGEAQGPMGEVTKRMREVEQRLGQKDTGEQTRQRQTEIVKNLEQLIEQARSSESKSQGKPEKQMAQGQPKPGDKEGPQPGANARGVGLQRPAKPETRHANANGKDEWGHLSPMMRAEMENTFKEDPLPSREELIKRYYTAVAKKALAREE